MWTSASEQNDDETAMPGEGKELFGPVVGALLAGLALSGLLDDSEAFVHPWWIVLLVFAAAIGLLLGARTVRKLLESGW